MMTTVALPSVEDLQAYLATAGWQEGSLGVAGSLWTKADSEIGVPSRPDNDLIRGAVERLARIEHRPLSEVSTTIRLWRFDVINLCIAGDNPKVESIPLSCAATIMQSAYRMLRAAGTTTIRTREEIRGGYSRLGHEMARAAQMGHTEGGSFVIPVLVPLFDRVPQEDTRGPAVVHIAAPEPPRRHATRTLAKSLTAICELIVAPARKSKTKSLDAAVEHGVSRELCMSLVRILKEPSVGRFEARFRWARTVDSPTPLPVSVILESSARNLIESAANQLRRKTKEIKPEELIPAQRYDSPNLLVPASRPKP